MSDALGIYVHFPFCRRRCPYCDFNVLAVSAVPHDAYREAVLAELLVRAEAFSGRPPAVSLYFGGGTPSLWRPADIASVIEAVDSALGLAPGAEITIECNPGETPPERFGALRAAGVNRVSLGTQSFDPRTLDRLGRRHSVEDNHRAIDAVRAADLDNLSLDLIQGTAGQSIADALVDVDAVIDLAPSHVSTYQLTIAARTPFGARAARGEVLTADEDTQLEIFEGTRARLRAAGIPPYEISNAAVLGLEAVHNSLYWTGDEYLALGAGAHGFARISDGGYRWENERHPARYMAAARTGRPAETFTERIDSETWLEERVLTGLRLDAGLTVDEALGRRFGVGAARAAARGWIEVAPDCWRLTERGRWLLDAVVLEIVSDPQSPSL